MCVQIAVDEQKADHDADAEVQSDLRKQEDTVDNVQVQQTFFFVVFEIKIPGIKQELYC